MEETVITTAETERLYHRCSKFDAQNAYDAQNANNAQNDQG